jgi:hypothetical protein
MTKIKKKIFKYLFLNRTKEPKTAYEITEATNHSWNTIKKYLDEMVLEKVVVRAVLYKRVLNTKTNKYELVKTSKKGYKPNIPLLRKKKLIN